MKKTQIGYLCKGDEFYYEGKRHKICGMSYHKERNNVCCRNIEEKRNVWLDVDTDVEVER